MESEQDFTDQELKQIADSAVVISKLEKWFTRAKKFREKRADRWRKNEALRDGDHWKNARNIKRGQSKITANYPLSNIMNQEAVINDHMPVFDVMPRDENDNFFADMMQKRKSQLESDSDLYFHVLDTVDDALTYSDGLIQILPVIEKIDDEANPDAENPATRLTGLDVEVLDIFTWLPDPWATGMDIRKKEARYHIFAFPMYTDEIEEQYGLNHVPAEGSMSDFKAFTEANEDDSTEDDMALVKQAIYWDKDTEKYPDGRMTLWVGKQLIEDAPLEGRCPIFKFSNYGTAHRIFGMGEPEIDRTITKAVNDAYSSINDNLKKTGNPVEKMTEKVKNSLDNGRVGRRIVVDNEQDFGYELPPPLPAYTQHFINQINNTRKEVVGNQDIIQGDKPPGVTAASALAVLREAAQGRIRLKIDHGLSKTIKDIGEYVVYLIQNFDDEIVNIRQGRNADGGYNFTKYDPVNSYDAQGLVEGDDDFDSETARRIGDTEFDISVTAGVQYPGGRVAREARATELYEAEIYGIEEWANASSEPDKQKLIDSWNRRHGQPGQDEEIPEEIMAEYERLVGMGELGEVEAQQLKQLIEQFPQLGGGN